MTINTGLASFNSHSADLIPILLEEHGEKLFILQVSKILEQVGWCGCDSKKETDHFCKHLIKKDINNYITFYNLTSYK